MRRLQSVGYVLAVKAITKKLSTALELSMSELKAAHSLARSLAHSRTHERNSPHLGHGALLHLALLHPSWVSGAMRERARK